MIHFSHPQDISYNENTPALITSQYPGLEARILFSHSGGSIDRLGNKKFRERIKWRKQLSHLTLKSMSQA